MRKTPSRCTSSSRILLDELEPRTLFSTTLLPEALSQSGRQGRTRSPNPAAITNNLSFRINHTLRGITSQALREAATSATSPDAPVEEALAGTTVLPGDANGDNFVDSMDLNIIAAHWNQPGTWTTGDFTGDNFVDSLDLNVLAVNWHRVLNVPPPPPPPPAYDWHTKVVNGVLNIWAPNPLDFGATWTVSDPAKLFGPDGIPNIEGVHQGPIADCYFLAAIGSMAYQHPDKVQQLVKNDPTGGWAVTFQYTNANGTKVPITIHTSSELSSTWQYEANNEVWPLVMEKAYAAFRTWNSITGLSLNTMVSLGWGFGGVALSQLFEPISTVTIASRSDVFIYDTIATNLAANHPILFSTSSIAPNMVGAHVYVITGASMDANGTRWITTYNPWGFYETRSLPDLMLNAAGNLNIGTS